MFQIAANVLVDHFRRGKRMGADLTSLCSDADHMGILVSAVEKHIKLGMVRLASAFVD